MFARRPKQTCGIIHGTHVYARCTPQACVYSSVSPGECPTMLVNNLFGSTNSQSNESPLLSGIFTTHRRLLNLPNVMCGPHVLPCCAMMVCQHVDPCCDHTSLGEPLRVRLAHNISALACFSCKTSGFHLAEKFPEAHHAYTTGV